MFMKRGGIGHYEGLEWEESVCLCEDLSPWGGEQRGP